MDEFTILFDLNENMSKILKDNYHREIGRILFKNREDNMNDKIIDTIPKIVDACHKICEDETILSCCVDMQVVNFSELVLFGIAVSSYSMLVASYLGIGGQELTDIGTAALIHNIGLCEMHQLIGLKDLQGANLNLWKEHPTYGYYYMKEKGIKEEVCKIIKAHLERYDGSGFPSGLKWDEIPIGARIISVCADYIAGVRQRDMPNYEMVEYIYANSGVAYDPVIVAAFVNNVPIYPLGSLVQLSTGEIGIVVNIRKNKGPRPIAQVMFNRVYKPITSPYMVDMGQEKTVFIKKVISYV